MELSNAEIVKRLREYAVVHPIGRMSPDIRVEKALLSKTADLIEQLEMDLEVCRMNIGVLREDLQDREELIDALMCDLRSITSDGNPFEAIMLREKWGFNK